jgi:hypothetical protein
MIFDKEKVEALSHELNKRFYYWRISQAEIEVERDLYNLKKINNPSFPAFVEIIEAFSKEEKIALLKALIKYQSSYSPASYIRMFTESMSDIESRTLEKFMARRESACSKYHWFINENIQKLSAKEIRKVLTNKVEAILGDVGNVDGKDFSYRKKFETWDISTLIYTQSGSFYYFHQIHSANPYIPPILDTGFPEWLGFNEGHICFLKNQSSTEVADYFAYFCNTFIEALPTLLSGLSVE